MIKVTGRFWNWQYGVGAARGVSLPVAQLADILHDRARSGHVQTMLAATDGKVIVSLAAPHPRVSWLTHLN